MDLIAAALIFLFLVLVLILHVLVLWDQSRRLKSANAALGSQYDALLAKQHWHECEHVILLYILSRLQNASFAEDPHGHHLPFVAKALGLDLDIRTSEKLMRKTLNDRILSDEVERILTGDPWSKDEFATLGRSQQQYE